MDISSLPSNLKDKHRHVLIESDSPKHTSTPSHFNVYESLGIDISFNLEKFEKEFDIKIEKLDEELLEVDLIGIDAPIANAIRRILIAEVPTMAIETVYITENSSVIKDELLAHRLGLIPIKADPKDFIEHSTGEAYTDRNVIVFTLNVECTMKPGAKEHSPDADKYENSTVYSQELIWESQGTQQFLGYQIKPVFSDIIIAKLRPGQVINLTTYCTKGIGKEHAKWSPVSTATYRLHPKIEVDTNYFKGKKAEELVEACPMNVFDIEDGDLIIKKERNCSMCRECIRPDEWDKHVKLKRVKDHFIFSIESVGQIPPEDIFKEALNVLLEKVNSLSQNLQDE